MTIMPEEKKQKQNRKAKKTHRKDTSLSIGGTDANMGFASVQNEPPNLQTSTVSKIVETQCAIQNHLSSKASQKMELT
jgi:hypothetical protein